MELDRTHEIQLELEGLFGKKIYSYWDSFYFSRFQDGAGVIHMLITVTGLTSVNIINDIDFNREILNESEFYKDNIIREYVCDRV